MNGLNVHKNILEVASDFDAILTDAFGVYWDGSQIISGSLEALEYLVKINKIVGILSNSSQPALKEKERYRKFGLLEHKHYHFLLTSGEVAKRAFLTDSQSLSFPFKSYWPLFAAHPKYGSPHHMIFKESSIKETTLDHADFIYIGIPYLQEEDQEDPNLFNESIQSLVSSGKPMVCINPDHFAQGAKPNQWVVRQGAIAHLYETMGGKVFYFGKPYPIVFEQAMNHFKALGVFRPQKIIMVGDTPETDIQGGNQAEMASALVTKTGVSGKKIEEMGLENFLSTLSENQRPRYLIQQLG
jgi:HAD superfamily hydrolase (TIGR01459 family)